MDQWYTRRTHSRSNIVILGEVAERPNASALKAEGCHSPVGSNPTLSAMSTDPLVKYTVTLGKTDFLSGHAMSSTIRAFHGAKFHIYCQCGWRASSYEISDVVLAKFRHWQQVGAPESQHPIEEITL